LQVHKASARLAGRVHPLTAERIIVLLRGVNSYYSNLIEGVRTTLLDIENSLKALSEDEKIRKLQILHRQNLRAQEEVEGICPGESHRVTEKKFLLHLHHLLFEGLPEEFLIQSDERGKRRLVMKPGTLRAEDVKVGGHVPPSSMDLPQLLDRFHEAYRPDVTRGMDCLIKAAASHHRLLWIHPFLEGNGRVARLFTDIYLRCSGLEKYGLWTLSRGLARRQSDYKMFLAGADALRRNDYDGRGNLSESALHEFCVFFLQTALDQAEFMDELLGLNVVEKNIELYCAMRNQGRIIGLKPLPKEASLILKHVFVHGSLKKGEVHKLINVSERKARDVTKALLEEGLLESENQKAPLTMGFPAEAVRFILPDLCDAGAFRGQAPLKG
jgi:Fic family protein